MTYRRLRLLLTLVVATPLGCDGLLAPACTLELGFELSPTSKTLRVGESLTPRGTVVTCGGRDRERADLALSVDDSDVVRLSADAKSLTAIGVGVVHVRAIDSRSGALGFIAIDVVAIP